MDGIIIKNIRWTEKVFLEKEPQQVLDSDIMLKNERYSFQAAVCFDKPSYTEYKIAVESELGDNVHVFFVGNVPVVQATRRASDAYYLSKSAGLYPDALLPGLVGRVYTATPCVWQSFWITVSGDNLPVGSFDIIFKVLSLRGEILASSTFTVTIVSTCLPQTDLYVTNWIHVDCICEKHGVEPFSKEFYEVFDSYVENYVALGNTMLLTPIFTPPLDTEYLGERMTVQLIDVCKEGEEYTFGFEKLDEFLSHALRRGVKYFEMSHLFSQWGAKYAPKIMAKVDGEYRELFGWHTLADSAEYAHFLGQLLPPLVSFLEEKGIEGFFHISDEPNIHAVEHYQKLRAFLKPYVGKYKMIDALSDIDFYHQGLVDVPVVALNHIKPFLERQAYCWVYYCNEQTDDYLSNRLICMPTLRTAIIGLQLYVNGAGGFLQWGHNFYHDFLSRRELNPFESTDCNGAFPAGDAFTVYPDVWAGTPINSIRGEAFANGMQHYRLMKLMESQKGREFCVQLLSEYGIEGYSVYPREDDGYCALIAKMKEMVISVEKEDTMYEVNNKNEGIDHEKI